MSDLEKKLADKFAIYSILPKAEQRGFIIGYRLLEDEIAELTKEVERLRKENESFTEVWEEMAGLFSKRYDDEECGIHFKQRMKFLINKLQS